MAWRTQIFVPNFFRGEIMRKFLIFCLVVAIFATIMVSCNNSSKVAVKESLTEFIENDNTTKETTSADSGTDNVNINELEKFKDVNFMTTGLLSINQLVNEPVVTVPSITNQNDYLHKDIYGSYSKSGTLFTEYSAIFGKSDVTCIYGHTMKDGKMFGSLTKFLKSDYLAENPFFSITTEEGSKDVRIVAVGHQDSDYKKTGWYYAQPNLTETEYEEFQNRIHTMAEQEPVDIRTLPYGTKYVILSCCSYAYDTERLLVVGQIL